MISIVFDNVCLHYLPSNISLCLGARQVTPNQGELEILVIREKREVTSCVSVLENDLVLM